MQTDLSPSSSDSQADFIASTLLDMYGREEIDKFLSDSGDYTKYQDDPVGFIENEMGITLTDDIREMAESVRDNRITVARSATGTGKSHGAAAISIWFYKCFPDSRVYTIANPYENQKILWGELANMAERSGLFDADKTTTMHIERSSKDFITALTVPTTGTEEVKEGKFSGKHHRHMLFVVDEGDTVPGFAYRGTEGCMSGGHVRMLVLFNPRYEAGEPYRHEYNKTAKVIHLSAFNHPNVKTGEDIIPGAVNREITVQRINEWCRPLTPGEERTANCFELPEFLEGATARKKGTNDRYPPLKPGWYYVNEAPFFYMVLGQYSPQPAQQLISREWVNNARSRWDSYVSTHGEVPPQGTRAILGLDVAEFGEDSNVLCPKYGGYVARLIDWRGVDTTVTAEKAARHYKDIGAVEAYVDATGIGTGVAPGMQKMDCVAVSVKVANSPTLSCDFGDFAQLRDQLWWMCREWLRTDPGAMLPPDEELVQELLTPTYEVTKGKVKIMPKSRTEGKVCMKDLLKRSPDRAESLILTFASSAGGYFQGCVFADRPEELAA
jgi:hypothetical protein